jgi:hypothetical protein
MSRNLAFSLSTLLAAVLAAPGGGQPPAQEVTRLTWQTYPALLQETAVRPEEMRWDRVRWKSDLFDGLVEAQAQDKPLFIFMFNGDLRSVC